MASEILVNAGLGNGLLPGGTKPLPEPMFIKESLWHSFQVNNYLSIQDINPQVLFEIYPLEIVATSPRGPFTNID